MNKAYQFKQLDDNTVELSIYGDITSYAWDDSDVTAHDFKEELKNQLGKDLLVRINSYGGEVAQGLAIYNLLKTYEGKVTTIVDGFACSAASIIFMAGEERIIPNTALLMIHNAWSFAKGDANDLRKAADDLEKITQPSIEAYKNVSTLSEERIKELMNNETWIIASEALEYGFATKITEDTTATTASQSAILSKLVLRNRELNKQLSLNENTNSVHTVTVDATEITKQIIEEINKELGSMMKDVKNKSETAQEFMTSFFDTKTKKEGN